MIIYEKIAITIPMMAPMIVLVAFFIRASSPRPEMSLIPARTKTTIQITPTAIRKYSLMILISEITSFGLLTISDCQFVAV